MRSCRPDTVSTVTQPLARRAPESSPETTVNNCAAVKKTRREKDLPSGYRDPGGIAPDGSRSCRPENNFQGLRVFLGVPRAVLGDSLCPGLTNFRAFGPGVWSYSTPLVCAFAHELCRNLCRKLSSMLARAKGFLNGECGLLNDPWNGIIFRPARLGKFMRAEYPPLKRMGCFRSSPRDFRAPGQSGVEAGSRCGLRIGSPGPDIPSPFTGEVN